MTAYDAEAVANAARSNFTLLDRLRHRPILTDSVKIYLDEPTGRELGGVEPQYRTVGTIEVPAGERRWGVLGKIADLEAKLADEAGLSSNEKDGFRTLLDELRAEAEVLRANLERSSVTIHLQALPGVIREAAAEAAAKALDLPEVPEEGDTAFTNQFAAEILTRMVTSMFDSDGNKLPDLTVEEALTLPKEMPRSEYARISRTVQKLQYENAISETVTNSADF